ncbi:phosphatase PAP2 family protein [Hwanghaeella sp. LZ110]|jgi:lipid A 4'-phosphatase|uniref:phosphatase PAP2 family protein n=1 Tax=Hwanghaeella sp. LZ110 TaxID=3402810 RepID=UPI003B66C5A5
MMSLGSPAWSTVWMLKICGLVFIALTVLFLPFPQIDLWVSKQVYLGENEFWLSRSEFTAFKNDVLRPLFSYLVVVGLVVFLWRLFTVRIQQVRKLARYAFLLLCLILSTGLVVHGVFKENWGRARPKQVTEFAGAQIFTPPLLPAQQCDGNCSFVSGDASVGYVFLALALYAAKRRKFWILVTVAAGIGMGILRVMNGSHFLSDILYAGVFTCGTNLILYRWFEEKKWQQDLAFLAPIARPVSATLVQAIPASVSKKLDPAALRFRALFSDTI